MKHTKGVLIFILMLAMLITGTLAAAAESVDWITVDSISEQINFEERASGTWATQTKEEFLNSGEVYARHATSYAEFTFSGTSIRWIGSKSNQRGIADVYIDDELVAEEIDLYSETPEYQQVLFEETDLEPGEHTIKVDPISESNPDSMFSYVGIDAFEYQPTLEGMLELTKDLPGEYFEPIVRGEVYSENKDILSEDKINEATNNLIKAYNSYNGQIVPQTQMSATATSEEEGSDPAKDAIDGSTGSIWHTAWDLTEDDELPQSITIDLGGTYDIMKLTYLPRQDGNPNGTITEYKLYASTDGEEFEEITSGIWEDNDSEKSVRIDPVEASHIKLEAIQGVEGWASAAEINLFREVE